jgi:hypothetical protein
LHSITFNGSNNCKKHMQTGALLVAAALLLQYIEIKAGSLTFSS